MQSYKELAYKYIKSKKGRTLAMIIGVTISVALITGIYALVDSYEYEILQSLEEERTEHMFIAELDSEDVSIVMNNIKLQDSYVLCDDGFVDAEYNNKYGPVNCLWINKVSMGYFDLQSIENKIVEGRLPNNKDEIIVDKDYLKSINKKIGDTIEVEYKNQIGENKKIKGLVVATDSGSSTITTIMDEDEVENKYKYSVGLKFKNPKDIIKETENIGELLGVEDILVANYSEEPKITAYYDPRYLMLIGGNSGDYESNLIRIAKGILMFLVVISSIGLIYNGFMIGVHERVKEFGLLRAVGMSKRQIRKIIIKEAILVGGIGTVLGVISGIGGIYCVLKIVSALQVSGYGDISLNISGMSIWGSILISLFTIIVSIIIPVNIASKSSPVDAIRNVSNKKGKIKVSKRKGLLSKIVGTSAELGYKNLRRDRGRFKVIVLGLTLSIFIFVSFFSYVETINKMVELQEGSGNYNIELIGNIDMEKIKEIPGVDYLRAESYLTPTPDEDGKYTDISSYKIKGFSLDSKLEGIANSLSYDVRVLESNVLDMKEIVLKDNMKNFENGIVIQNKAVVIKENKKEYIDLTNHKIGDKVDLEISLVRRNESKEMEVIEEKIVIKDVEIVGLLKDTEVFTYDMVLCPIMLLSKEVKDEIVAKTGNEASHLRTLVYTENNIYVESVYKDLKENEEKYNITNIYNETESQKEFRKMVLVFQIGVYGFLILITTISLANILTSITANIYNRRKEVALYRSIGASEKYIKKMIYSENFSYGIYSLLIGGTLGTILSILIAKSFGEYFTGIFVFPIKSIFISGSGLFIFLFIVSKYSIKRICHKNIVDEIREN